ncbi:MAG: exonuclease SbcCD subunit D C-terminal domain-containing protein [Bacteriovoracaceae bacterium]|nr:exonuclease SbcCD subunit D C-terminal domain-containing protein [Bacteriovoracaceae bacterium]
MRIIHTSDWHLGKSLYGQKRSSEFASFLNWLAECIEQQQADALLIAGDIFDTTTPSNAALQLYYQFLCRVSLSCCQHIVIIAGNHDSPTLLNAPKEILQALNIHVVGCATADPQNEVITLRNKSNEAQLIVCATPYLRDRDIKLSSAGESIEDKDHYLQAGIIKHYQDVCKAATSRQLQLGGNIPIVAMGHLFTAGGTIGSESAVRDLYVGNLGHIPKNKLPSEVDYMALGHLHVPQTVAGSQTIRYSGSPIPLSFGEANQQKLVVVVDLEKDKTEILEVPVPIFLKLETIKGNWPQIQAQLTKLVESKSNAWLEIVYNGEHIIGDLSLRLREITKGSDLSILRVKNNKSLEQAIQSSTQEALEDLTPMEVFHRCLKAQNIPTDQRPQLIESYQLVLHEIEQLDEFAK